MSVKGSITGVLRTTYKYSDCGLLLEVNTYDDGSLNHKTIYTYDDNGSTIKVESYEYDKEDTFIKGYCEEYHYDTSDQVIESVSFEF